MGLTLITPASGEPLTVADVKLQCRIDGSDEDSLLTMMIQAARAKAENYIESPILSQVWRQSMDAFPSAEIELRKRPVTEIVSVQYVDVDGATQTMPDTLYALDPDTFPGWLLPAYGTVWPATQASANAVAIQLKAGYANAAAVPADIRAWLLLTCGFLYANRESFVLGGRIAEIPGRFVDSLLDPYRVFKA